MKDERVDALLGRVSDLEGQVEKLEKSNESLSNTLLEMTIENAIKNPRSAYLTPGEDGYSLVNADLGTISVKIANIVSYANGSRVTLSIGNLTSATINGLKATMNWGPVDDRGLPVPGSEKTRDITLKESLQPGAWSMSSVVLEGVPPEAFGFLRVKDVSHTGIALRR